MSRNNGLTITKCLVVESGTYDEQYRRPYMTTLTGDAQQLITDRFSRHKGEVSTGSVIAGVASKFLQPQMQPEGVIDVPNGWAQVRYRALVEAVWTSGGGNQTRMVIMAFSDFCDPSLSGLLDPEVNFTINSVTALRDYTQDFGHGKMPMTGVANTSHLLSDNDFGGYETKHREYRNRPEDVFSTISSTMIDNDTEQGDIYDTRTINAKQTVKSERKNTVASSFAAKVLSGYKTAHLTAGALGGTGFDVMSEAQHAVAENDAMADLFLKEIRDIRREAVVRNNFCIQDLIDMSPESMTGMDRVLHVVPMNQVKRAGMYHTGESESWGAANEITKVATQLAQAIPSLMMEQLMTRAIITASNRTRVDGAIDVKVSEYDSFTEMDLTNHVLVLEARIATEVMPDISDNNNIDFDIDMMIQSDGESRFTISLYGNSPVEYVCPTFADSLLVPVLTTDQQRSWDMGSDFRELGDLIVDAAQSAPTLKNAVYQTSNGRNGGVIAESGGYRAKTTSTF